MSQPTPSYGDDLSMRIYADLQKTHQDVLKSGYDRAAEITAANERYELAEEARNQRNTQSIIDTIHNTSSVNLTATERNGSANLAATNKVGSDLGIQAEKLANENAFLFGKLGDRVSDYFYNTAKDFCHVGEGINDTKFALVKVENSLGRQADHNYAALQKQLCDVTGRLELQAANNTAAIQIEALKTKGDIVQKMAECCCEIKEKVSSSEDSLRALIQSTDIARIRDALHLAETRNVFNQSRHCGYPPFPFPPPPPQWLDRNKKNNKKNNNNNKNDQIIPEKIHIPQDSPQDFPQDLPKSQENDSITNIARTDTQSLDIDLNAIDSDSSSDSSSISPIENEIIDIKIPKKDNKSIKELLNKKFKWSRRSKSTIL